MYTKIIHTLYRKLSTLLMFTMLHNVAYPTVRFMHIVPPAKVLIQSQMKTKKGNIKYAELK